MRMDANGTSIHSSLLYDTLLYWTLLFVTRLCTPPVYPLLVYSRNSMQLYSTYATRHSTLLFATRLYYTLLYSLLCDRALLYSTLL